MRRTLTATLFYFAFALSVLAQGLLLEGVTGVAPAPIVANTDNGTNNSVGGTTATFTTRAVGTAFADRYVYVVYRNTGGSLPDLTSATIGGVAATLLVSEDTGAIEYGAIGALVPTGTTATVVLNTNNSMTQSCIFVVTARYLRRPLSTPVNDMDSATTIPALNADGGDVALGFVRVIGGTLTSLSNSWTNGSGLTSCGGGAGNVGYFISSPANDPGPQSPSSAIVHTGSGLFYTVIVLQ